MQGMQLVCFGWINNFMSNFDEFYALSPSSYRMRKKQTDGKYLYSTIITKSAFVDKFSIEGFNVLNEDNEINQIELEKLDSLELKIFSLNVINSDTGTESEITNLIGSIPFYLCEYKFVGSKIFIKFPEKILTGYKYLNLITEYYFQIVSQIDLGTIKALIITYGAESNSHNALNVYRKYYSNNRIQYTSRLESEPIKILNSNSYLLRVNINQINMINGVFIMIPDELVDLVDSIELNLSGLGKFKYHVDMLANNKKDTSGYTVYWIGIFDKANRFDYLIPKFNEQYYLTSHNDWVEINFLIPDSYINSELKEAHDITFNNYANRIYIDMLVKNRIIGFDGLVRLKYSNGLVNPELEPKNIQLINKYRSTNVDIEQRYCDTLEYLKQHLLIEFYNKIITPEVKLHWEKLVLDEK